MQELGCSVAVVTGRTDLTEYPIYKSVRSAVAVFNPEYCVIASITSLHHKHLEELQKAGFTNTALVEKPIFDHLPVVETNYVFDIFVGYNLRFHPLTFRLKQELEGRHVYAAHVLTGQHLSTWRSERDHLRTYSAHSKQGGGVIRDLSHEYDLAAHLFGELALLSGVGRRVSSVTIDSEDVAAAIFSGQSCPIISVSTNYLDRTDRRCWVVITEDATFEADYVSGTFSTNGNIENLVVERDQSYRDMHRAAIGDKAGLCRLADGTALLALLEQFRLT
ncbi:Gfo/Idh/MocA family oxidoreductase [Roseibium denhamense]